MKNNNKNVKSSSSSSSLDKPPTKSSSDSGLGSGQNSLSSSAGSSPMSPAVLIANSPDSRNFQNSVNGGKRSEPFDHQAGGSLMSNPSPIKKMKVSHQSKFFN